MKRLHLSVAIGVTVSVIVTLVIIGALRDTAMHTKMRIVGLDDVYAANQTIRFQIYAEGYGYSCTGTPDIAIYKTGQPSAVLFHQRSITFMCPLEPALTPFSVYFPSKSDYYSTTIRQSGNYTLDVSYRGTEIQKEFVVGTK
ncbi:MAG TPA: hypothetical protein VJ771_06050 [Candidatus Nitrosotalea sp.]|nr:hypothetical protein [Candidatus Nitrosotalea sp.]